MDPKLFRKLSVSGDGSCFFHSLVTIFYIEKEGSIVPVPNIKNKSKELRRKCIDWLQKNLNYKVLETGLSIRQEIEDAVMVEGRTAKDADREEKYTDVNGYLEYMKDMDGYAGQIEIYAIAELYQRNVRVFNRKGNKLNNMGLGYELNNNGNDIFLFHNFKKKMSAGLHHFEPLILKDKIKKLPNKNTRRRSPNKNTRRRSPNKNTRRRDTRSKRRDTRSKRRDTRRRDTRRRDTRSKRRDTRSKRRDTRSKRRE